MTTLGNVVASLAALHPEATIFAAEPWNRFSRALCVVQPEDEDGPPPTGLTYVLDVSVACEVQQVWSEWRGGAIPTLDELTQAIVWYAVHDAYLPVL